MATGHNWPLVVWPWSRSSGPRSSGPGPRSHGPLAPSPLSLGPLSPSPLLLPSLLLPQQEILIEQSLAERHCTISVVLCVGKVYLVFFRVSYVLRVVRIEWEEMLCLFVCQATFSKR